MEAVVGARRSRQVSFVGPFGVGKTTAVCTISDTDVASSEVQSSAMRMRTGRHLKTSTTVGLEIGSWRTPAGEVISVVGTPGQERFDQVRKAAMPSSLGVVIWLYGQHDYALLDAELWLEFIAEEVETSRLTVVITRLEEAPGRRLADFAAVVAAVDPTIPVLAADPRNADDVAAVLLHAARLTAPAQPPVAAAAVIAETAEVAAVAPAVTTGEEPPTILDHAVNG